MAQAQDTGNPGQQSTQQKVNQPAGGMQPTPSAQAAQAQPTPSPQPTQAMQPVRRNQNQGTAIRPIRRSRSTSSSLALSPFFSASPFGMVRRVFDDMERMMESMFSELDEMGPDTSAMSFNFVPKVDVTRQNDMINVHVDLPGLSPEDLEVQATQDGLVITGERRHDAERTQGDMWQSERSYGRFYRLIPMPEGTDLENAQVRFENGVLEVSLKAPAGYAAPRRIEIQSHGGQQTQQRQGQTGQTGQTPQLPQSNNGPQGSGRAKQQP